MLQRCSQLDQLVGSSTECSLPESITRSRSNSREMRDKVRSARQGWAKEGGLQAYKDRMQRESAVCSMIVAALRIRKSTRQMTSHLIRSWRQAVQLHRTAEHDLDASGAPVRGSEASAGLVCTTAATLRAEAARLRAEYPAGTTVQTKPQLEVRTIAAQIRAETATLRAEIASMQDAVIQLSCTTKHQEPKCLSPKIRKMQIVRSELLRLYYPVSAV